MNTAIQSDQANNNEQWCGQCRRDKATNLNNISHLEWRVTRLQKPPIGKKKEAGITPNNAIILLGLINFPDLWQWSIHFLPVGLGSVTRPKHVYTGDICHMLGPHIKILESLTFVTWEQYLYDAIAQMKNLGVLLKAASRSSWDISSFRSNSLNWFDGM